MFIVDGHEDIASNVLHHGRDPRLSVEVTRERERAREASGGAPVTHTAMIGLPELRRGGVGLVFATIFCFPGEPEKVTADGLAQLQYYHDLVRDEPGFRLVTSQRELHTLTADWPAAAAPDERPVGLALLMEGADPLTTPADLEAWYARGLRLLGPSWKATRYAGGTSQPGGLTALGRELLAEMQRLGMILDLSHLAEEAVWQALETYDGTIIASHANCREYVPTDRHLTDDMIREVARRDGVIGAVLHNGFVVHGWKRGTSDPVTLDAVVRHIDRVCQLTGSARHSAIGSDFDGGAGVESTPVEFDTVADLGTLADALERAGYSRADIEGILGGNWLRVLRQGLPA